MSFLLNTDSRGIVQLTLNRPEKHNAFDDTLIQELTLQLQQLDADPAVRVVLLAAQGKSFSAGADLEWMRRVAHYSLEENLEDASHLALLMHTLHSLSKPTIALVQGPALGGGVGLVACCDIAIATTQAHFCLSEVKLGLVPSVISPYVIKAMGERATRRYALTAEKITAEEALRLGLVHQVVEDSQQLMSTAEFLAEILCKNSPSALQATKQLFDRVSNRPIDHHIRTLTTHCIAHRRMSADAQEGMTAFLEKKT